MIYGFGNNAWIASDVPCKVSRNGSFVQIEYEEMGVHKCIRIPERYLKQINDFEKHRDNFETFCEISEPANRFTLDEEEKTRRDYYSRRLESDRPK